MCREGGETGSGGGEWVLTIISIFELVILTCVDKTNKFPEASCKRLCQSICIHPILYL